jgi:hypothetical protein
MSRTRKDRNNKVREQVAGIVFGQQQRLTEDEENAQFLREEEQQRQRCDRNQTK